MKRQALKITVNELRELADDLERETRQFNVELGEKDVVGFDKKWSLNIINKSGTSDGWEFEK